MDDLRLNADSTNVLLIAQLAPWAMPVAAHHRSSATGGCCHISTFVPPNLCRAKVHFSITGGSCHNFKSVESNFCCAKDAFVQLAVSDTIFDVTILPTFVSPNLCRAKKKVHFSHYWRFLPQFQICRVKLLLYQRRFLCCWRFLPTLVPPNLCRAKEHFSNYWRFLPQFQICRAKLLYQRRF